MLLAFAAQQSGMRARQFQRAFPRFGAGVGKEDAIHARALRQPQRQFRLSLVIEEVRRVDQRSALVHDGSLNRRMPVAQRIHADAAQQVEILRTALVNQVHALAADKQDRVPFVGLKAAAAILLREFGPVSSHLISPQATITSVPWATRLLHRSGREPAASAGKILTRFTPFSSASRQALSLGSIPPEMTALFAISAIWSMLSHRSTSPSAPFTPGTSVRKTSASAWHAIAQAAAISSALML